MAGEFSGKVVMISGAGGNVGRAVCAKFAADGAKLVLIERNRERLLSFAKELHDQYKMETLVVPLDVTNRGEVDAMIRQIEDRFGQIDVLAHTVGGFTMGDPVHDMNMDVVEKMLNLNLFPIYALCGRVAKHMLDKQVAGKIVIMLARAAIKGAANSSAYNASKAAAQSVMESMSLELRDYGINVNGIMPSIIDTPPNREGMPKADFSKWVTVEDIANTIYFLASDASKSLHGASLEVYGRA
jgi:NAD(P)-dependent dehydrogenase (short-subunit alcohol dehydrogenase family)